MHYYIYKHDDAPSGIAVIISFNDFKIIKDDWDQKRCVVEKYNTILDNVPYLGGPDVSYVIDGGFSVDKILTEHMALKKIFSKERIG